MGPILLVEIKKSITVFNSGTTSESTSTFWSKMSVGFSIPQPARTTMGSGIWDLYIRTTRKILSALLKEQILSDEALLTLLREVESIMNGRPMTQISDDPRDLEALTPNQMLLLRSGSLLPPGIFRKEDIFSRKRWRQVQYLADQFRRRLSREYIPLLQQRPKWNFLRRNLAKGDVVLVVDESSPRSCWPEPESLKSFQEVTNGCGE